MGSKTTFGPIEKLFGLENELRWITIATFSFMHIVGPYWSYFYAFPVKWQTLVLAVCMYLMSGAGITCGAHRLWAHRSYKAKLPLRIMLMIWHSATAQNSIYKWVRDHRVHHKYSDTAADPHDARRGFWFSHIGWLFMKKSPLVIEKGREIDISDLENDPVVMFEKKYTDLLSLIFCFFLPTVTAVLLWGEEWKCAVAWQCFIRVLLVLHAELSVNSFAHMYGYKPYNKDIKPAQNFFVSAATVGEGWHNYHHSFPNDYRAAETFDILNWSTFCIDFWAKIGQAYDLKEVNLEAVEALKKEDNCVTTKAQ